MPDLKPRNSGRDGTYRTKSAMLSGPIQVDDTVQLLRRRHLLYSQRFISSYCISGYDMSCWSSVCCYEKLLACHHQSRVKTNSWRLHSLKYSFTQRQSRRLIFTPSDIYFRPQLIRSTKSIFGSGVRHLHIGSWSRYLLIVS